MSRFFLMLIVALSGAVTGRAQSANNNFANAIVINGNSFSGSVTISANTKEAGEPNHGGQPGGRSAWWAWTPSVSALYNLTTVGSTATNTVLAVYENTAPSLPTAAHLIRHCDDTTTSARTALVRIRATAGTTYRIAVDTTVPATGNVTLNISTESNPSGNDNFANASVLSPTLPIVISNGSNSRCSWEPGEPRPHSDRGRAASVWYRFTPAADAIVQVRVTPTTTSATVLKPMWAVYTGASVGSLTRVGAFFPFAVTAGTPYYIQVTGWDRHLYFQEGSFNLRVDSAAPISRIVLPAESEWDWLHPTSGGDPTEDSFWWELFWREVGDDLTEFNGHTFHLNGKAPFGFGGIDLLPGTVTHIGTPANNTFNNAAYFRTRFYLPAPSDTLWAELLCDDGAYVYLNDGNGVPVNMALSGGQPVPDAFRTAGSNLAGARHRGTAIRLADGRVLVAGGNNGNTVLNTTEIYNPTTGRWAAAPNMTSQRSRHTATLLNDGRVLVVGGIGANNAVLNTAEVYNPTANTWTAVASMAEVRERHFAVLLPNGKVLVGGGYSGSAARTSCQRFNPANNQWEGTSALPAARFDVAAVRLNSGHVLVTGGNSGSAHVRRCDIYHPTDNYWRQTADLDSIRSRHTASLLPDGRVLVAGGVDTTGAIASAEIIDAPEILDAPTAYDGFQTGNPATATAAQYSAAGVGNQNPGIAGWTGAWSNGSGNSTVNATGLTYAGLRTLGGRLITPTGARSGRVLSQPVNSATTGTRYLSFLLRIDSDTPAAYRAFELHNGGFVDGTHRVLQLGQSSTDFGNANIGLRVANNNSLRLNLGAFDTAVNLYVIRFNLSSAANSDSLTVWRNPASLGGAEPGGGQTLTGLNLAFDRTTLAHFTTSPDITLDEMRWGSTWRSVTPTDPAWQGADFLLSSRADHEAIPLADGRVLVTGGTGIGGARNSAEIYDPATLTWSSTASLTTARYLHSSTLLNDGRVLAAGGYDGGASMNSVEILDAAQTVWTSSQGAAAANATNTEITTQRILLTSGYTLPAGWHTVAVSMHQNSETSSDQGFDLQLYEAPPQFGREITGQGLKAQFQQPAENAMAFLPPDNTSELGWTSTSAGTVANVRTESAVITPAAFQILPATNKFIVVRNNSELVRWVSEAVDISSLPAVKATAKFRAFTNASGDLRFENTDYVEAYVETSQDGVTYYPAADLVARLDGSGTAPEAILFNFGPPENPVGNTPNLEWAERRVRIDPNLGKSARIVIAARADQANEHLLIDEVGFEKIGCRLFALVRQRTHDNLGDDDPANDTWSFTPFVTAEDVGASSGWLTTSGGFSGTYELAEPIGPFAMASGNQTLTFRDALNAACAVTVVATPPACKLGTPLITNLIRNPGANENDLDDDFFEFDLTLEATAASTGWTTDSLGAPVQGDYGVPTRITMPLTPNPRTLVLRDRGTPGCTVNINVTGPAATQYVIGDVVVENLPPVDLLTPAGSTPPARWKNPADKLLRNNNGGNVFETVTSNWVDLRFLSGPIGVSARLRAIDTSGDSNFEQDERFQLFVDVDDGLFIDPVNLILGHPADTNGDGLLRGSGTGSANYVIADDEFNLTRVAYTASFNNTFEFSYAIPAGMTAARLRIVGATNSGSETLEVDQVRITTTVPQDLDNDGLWDGWESYYFGSTNASPTVDFDLDGLDNYGEFLAGTQPDEPLDVLFVDEAIRVGTDLHLAWSSKLGKTYQIYESVDPFNPAAWFAIGAPVVSQGDFQTTAILPNATEDAEFRYYRVRVLEP
jgi:hypothetical protein